VNFEAWLISKKIDGEAFSKAEPALFASWKMEFEQLHPNSFTVQKLNLINPVRRKYKLKIAPIESVAPSSDSSAVASSPAAPAKPVAKPVMRPKPKIS
jgi:hypothetical protein